MARALLAMVIVVFTILCSGHWFISCVSNFASWKEGASCLQTGTLEMFDGAVGYTTCFFLVSAGVAGTERCCRCSFQPTQMGSLKNDISLS